MLLDSRPLIYPTLGNQLLPNFKERDFLMHWLTEPAPRQPEETRISVRACKDLREIPGVRNCGSHIGQALEGDEVYGVDFGENWISVDKNVDYDKTLAAVHRTVEGYPGLYRDVQTYLRERIKEVLTGTSESIVVRSSGPTSRCCATKSEEIAKAIGASTASSTRTRASRRTCRTSRSRSTSPRRAGTASSRATSAGSPRRCWPARRSATSSTAARPTTCTCAASRRRATA